MDLLRGYRSEQVGNLARSANRIDGPTSLDIVAQDDSTLTVMFEQLDIQPDVEKLTLIDCELSARTWETMFEKLPSIHTIELARTRVFEGTNELDQLASLTLRNCLLSDGSLDALAALQSLKHLYIISEDVDASALSSAGLLNLCMKAPSLVRVSGAVRLAPKELSMLKGELAFSMPELEFVVDSIEE